MQNLRRMSANTKAIILGNGGSYVQSLKHQIDAFLREAQKLNDAAWKALLEGRDKLYKLVDAFVQPEKTGGNKNINELKRAWRKTASSGRSLVKELQRGTKQTTKHA